MAPRRHASESFQTGSMRRRLPIFDLIVALAAFAYFSTHLPLPLHLATLLGLAVGLLSYSARRTWRNLRRLYSAPPIVSASSEDSSPPVAATASEDPADSGSKAADPEPSGSSSSPAS